MQRHIDRVFIHTTNADEQSEHDSEWIFWNS